VAVCEVCGGDSCTGFPDTLHLITYPFLPGGYPVRRPDMVDDVVVQERIWHDGYLVATAGDRISAGDAQRWRVGANGKQLPPAPALPVEPVEEPAPAHATKPKARTRPKPLETRT
jgi:hypothetical protein